MNDIESVAGTSEEKVLVEKSDLQPGIVIFHKLHSLSKSDLHPSVYVLYANTASTSSNDQSRRLTCYKAHGWR